MERGERFDLQWKRDRQVYLYRQRVLGFGSYHRARGQLHWLQLCHLESESLLRLLEIDIQFF